MQVRGNMNKSAPVQRHAPVVPSARRFTNGSSRHDGDPPSWAAPYRRSKYCQMASNPSSGRTYAAPMDAVRVSLGQPWASPLRLRSISRRRPTLRNPSRNHSHHVFACRRSRAVCRCQYLIGASCALRKQLPRESRFRECSNGGRRRSGLHRSSGETSSR